jgi:hypothetical protein
VALDLTLKVTADASQAKGELRAVEEATQKATAAAKDMDAAQTKLGKSITQTTLTAAEFRKQLAASGGDLSKIKLNLDQATASHGSFGAAQKKTIEFSDLVSGSLKLQTRSIEGLFARMADMGSRNGVLIRAFGSLGEAMGLSTSAAIGLTGGLAAIIGAATMEGKVLLDAAEYHYEHAKSMQGLRAEVEHTTSVYHAWEGVLGTAISGSGGTAITGLRLLDAAFGTIAISLTKDILLAKEFANFAGQNFFGVNMGATEGATSPDDNWRKALEQRAAGLARGQGHFSHFDDIDQILRDQEKAKREAAAAAKREADAMSVLTGQNTLGTANDDLRRLSGLSIDALPITQLDKVNDDLQAAIQLYARRGQVAPQALLQEAAAVSELVRAYTMGNDAMMTYRMNAGAEMAANFAAFGAFAAHVPTAYAGFTPGGTLPGITALSGIGGIPFLATQTSGGTEGGNFLLPSHGVMTTDEYGKQKPLGPLTMSRSGANYEGNLAGGPPSAKSFFDLLFGSVGGDIGHTLEGLLIHRGQAGSALGGSLGGDVMKSVMGSAGGFDITKFLTGNLGKSIGGAVGSFIPFGGQLLGSAIGSLFGKLFGQTQYQKDQQAANANISQMWTGANTQYNGQADQVLSMFGLTNGNTLHGAGYQGAMGQTALQGVFDQLSQKTADFNSNLGGTLQKIQALGGGVPKALLPYIDELTKANVLTKQNADLVKAMTGDGTVGLDQMKQAAQNLGISTDKLGQNFQDMQAKASWQSIIDDLDTLQRGGANLNDLLGDAGLQKKLNDLVLSSKKFGTEIPANMKTTLETLASMGDLFDENGNKMSVADVDGMKWGADLQTTLDSLNDTLKTLIEALGIKLPSATKATADAWHKNLDDLQVPDPNTPGYGGKMPKAGGGDATTPGASALRVSIPVYLDGLKVAQGMAPHLADVLQAHGAR